MSEFIPRFTALSTAFVVPPNAASVTNLAAEPAATPPVDVVTPAATAFPPNVAASVVVLATPLKNFPSLVP